MEKKKIIKTLQTVLDPELGVSVYDLGLIYDIDISAEEVVVEMTLTNPHCPFMQQLQDKVEEAVVKVAGDRTVRVKLVFEPAWTPERMSPAAKEKLGWSEE